MSNTQSESEMVYCRTCGNEIQRAAEICTGCGVRNPENPANQAGSSLGRSRGKQGGVETENHDPNEYNTTVSGSWVVGVAAGCVGWVGYLLISAIVPFDIIVTLASIFGLAAWIILPVSVYFDSRYVRANSLWDATDLKWVIGAAIPVLGFVAGLLYLRRRNETLGLDELNDLEL